ncbi:MAG: CHAT domain-containing tetratricopeptide repeat protein [Bacteroidota bacterium]
MIRYALDLQLALCGEIHLTTANAYSTLGDLKRNTGDYYQALKLFRKVEEILKKLRPDPNHIDFGSVYGNIGLTYSQIGDFASSNDYLLKALSLFREKLQENHQFLLTAYAAIGDNYKELNNCKQAVDYYREIKTALKKDTLSLAYASYLIGMGFCKGKTGNLREEINYHERALYVTEEIAVDNNIYSSTIYENLVVAYSNIGNYKKALEYAFILVDYYKEQEQFLNRARIFNKIGYVYDEQKNHEEAKKWYNKAIHDLQMDNREIENIPYPREYQYAYWNRMVTLLSQYRITGNIQYLKECYEDVLKLVQQLDHLRSKYDGVSSKQFLNQENKVVYDRAICTALELYKLDQEKDFQIDAFTFSEKSKAYLLLEALKETDITAKTDIFSALKTIKQGINFYQKKIDEEVFKDTLADQKEILKWKSLLFDEKKKEEQLLARLDTTNYQAYFQELSNITTIKVQEIQQQLLSENQALIEYFLGDSTLFIFLIRKNDFLVYTQERTSNEYLEKQVKQMLENLSKADQISTEHFPKNRQYAEAAHQLYQQLIEPLEKDLEDIERLIIVPDDVLGRVPFDALLKTMPDDPNEYSSLSYLLRDYQISYAYSATLLQEMCNKQVQPKRTLLAVAPHTISEQDGLEPLQFSVESVENISKIVRGVALMKGDDARLKNFLAVVEQYGILHIATHARLDDRGGDYAYLTFTTDNDSVAYKLYIRDLYNLSLNAQMVVLSACQTADGTLQKGEGILSLARGFAYAGAKSIVPTLWQVDDKATTDLMKLFYEELRKGKTKDAALQTAKLKYLQEIAESSRKVAPYYWAAFVPIGDMEAIFPESSNLTYFGWVFGLLLLVCLLILLLRSRKKENTVNT